MRQILKEEEKHHLIQEHRKIKEKRLADRIKCILLLNEGYTITEVAHILLLDETTISNYKDKYLEGGLNRLLELNYKAYDGKMDQQQLEGLKKHLRDNLYRSAKEIVRYVKKRFGIEYTPEGMVHLLHRLEFVYKKTKQVPAKADPEKQKAFVEAYKKLKSAKKESDKIYFIDAIHPIHNSENTYGWIYKGDEKELPSNSGRKRVNINGALNPEGYEVVYHEDDRINANSTIRLFKEIEQKHPEAKNIYVIHDNSKAYKNKAVERFANSSRIKLIPLPPYSPNLNLIERLWKFFKNKVIKGRYYENFEEFKKAIKDFFLHIGIYKEDLRSLLTENFQIFYCRNT